MDEAKFLLQIIEGNVQLNESQIKEIYLLDPKLYDYENHKRSEVMDKLLASRDIRHDLATILHCNEDEIAFFDEKMDPRVKFLYTGLHIVDTDNHQVLNGRMHDLVNYVQNIKKEKKEESKESISEKVRLKSVSPKKMVIPYTYHKKKELPDEIKRKIKDAITFFIACGTLVSTVAITNYVSEHDGVKKFIDNYRHIVSEEKRRTDDNEYFYYLSSNIAEKIASEKENQEEVLYAVYSIIKSDATHGTGTNEVQVDHNMDLLMSDLSLYSDNYHYASFDEYLVDKGFVTKDGKPDTKRYETEMRSYINKMVEDNEFQFTGGRKI